MLLQILRTLECFAAEVTFVRLQRDVHTDMGSDVITLDSGSSAVAPLTSQVQVVGAFSTDMAFTDVVLEVGFVSRREYLQGARRACALRESLRDQVHIIASTQQTCCRNGGH